MNDITLKGDITSPMSNSLLKRKNNNVDIAINTNCKTLEIKLNNCPKTFYLRTITFYPSTSSIENALTKYFD